MFCVVIVILFSDDSEETKDFIASVFQPVQLGCDRYAQSLVNHLCVIML